jgi:hypothetical protein
MALFSSPEKSVPHFLKAKFAIHIQNRVITSSLITRWDGEFTVDGVSARIPGEITTVSVLPITVVTAPIRFMN